MDKLGGVIMDRRRLMMNDTITILDGKPIITCKRSKGSKFADLKLFGKSEQFKTTGKNLFNISETVNNGLATSDIEITDTDYLTGTIKAVFSSVYQQLGVVINAESNTTYTLSFAQENSKKDELEVRAYYFKDNTPGEYIDGITASSKDIKFTFTTSSKSLIAVWFRPKGVYSKTETNTCTFTNIQLEKSPIATPYEPYTGGQPSPSPDYPQEIKSVVNPTMKVYGKNLWDNFKTLSLGNVKQENGTYIATTGAMQVDITLDSVGARPLLLKANNAYTFSLKTTVSISRPRFICLKYTNGEIDNFIFVNQNFVNFVPKRDVEKVGFILYDSVAGDKAYDAQLEMGSEATPYEPYHEQNVILPYTLNAIPVSSGGNVTIDGQQYIADYVDVKRGKLVRNIEIATFDGSDDEGWSLATVNNARMFITSNYFPFSKADTKYGTYIITNMFKSLNNAWAAQNINRTYIEGTGRLNIEAPGIKNTDALKALLRAENLICYAYREKSTEIPLTPDEIAVYKTLHTYTGITNISNDAEAWMQVSYRKVR